MVFNQDTFRILSMIIFTLQLLTNLTEYPFICNIPLIAHTFPAFSASFVIYAGPQRPVSVFGKKFIFISLKVGKIYHVEFFVACCCLMFKCRLSLSRRLSVSLSLFLFACVCVHMRMCVHICLFCAAC